MPTFRRYERIKKSFEYKRVYENGERTKDKYLTVYVLKAEEGRAYSKVGFSVSKKFFKKAVLRNRVKRLLKEVFRINKDKIKKGYDIVIIPHSPVVELKFSDIASHLLNTLNLVLH